MSMKINGINNGINHYSQINSEEKWKEEQAIDSTQETKKVYKSQNDTKAGDKIFAPQDEYIRSEKADEEGSGLYQLVQDENGNRKIVFDDPKKSGEKCTCDTDKVDKEIKKLKEKKKQLEQQIQMASQDEEKVRELEKELARVESELVQKDNDTYRRQNSSFSQ